MWLSEDFRTRIGFKESLKVYYFATKVWLCKNRESRSNNNQCDPQSKYLSLSFFHFVVYICQFCFAFHDQSKVTNMQEAQRVNLLSLRGVDLQNNKRDQKVKVVPNILFIFACSDSQKSNVARSKTCCVEEKYLTIKWFKRLWKRSVRIKYKQSNPQSVISWLQMN